ncbi:MAG: hypothetical protein KF757_04245 [Phycisphaeraceae bacterium]|nr:hypothetical protein [Phycisphaeraceae bacterium]MCW5764195.1 hypothetical protein [Phycisphaeraceae bacterium]
MSLDYQPEGQPGGRRGIVPTDGSAIEFQASLADRWTLMKFPVLSTRYSGRRAGLVSLVLVCILALQLPMVVALAPEPDPVPTRWELDFQPGPLRVMWVELPNQPARHYFYMTYRVTNYSGQDLIFAPSFDLVTAEGAIRRAGREVPPEVTAYLLGQLRSPYLEDQISILGQILQGIENARDGLIVWPADDLETDGIQVFAAGLSGEYKPFVVRDPETKRNKRVMLRKTLMLSYDTPGMLQGRGPEPLPLTGSLWVMR